MELALTNIHSAACSKAGVHAVLVVEYLCLTAAVPLFADKVIDSCHHGVHCYVYACAGVVASHCMQGNVVSGTAPGTVDSAVAVNPDGEAIQGPPDAQTQAMEKEHAETLLQVS